MHVNFARMVVLAHIENIQEFMVEDLEKGLELDKEIKDHLQRYFNIIIMSDSNSTKKTLSMLSVNKKWFMDAVNISNKMIESIFSSSVKVIIEYELKEKGYNLKPEISSRLKDIYNIKEPEIVLRDFIKLVSEIMNSNKYDIRYKQFIVAVFFTIFNNYIENYSLYLTECEKYRKYILIISEFIDSESLVPKKIIKKIEKLSFFGNENSEEVYRILFDVIDEYNKVIEENITEKKNKKNENFECTSKNKLYVDSIPVETRTERIRRYKKSKCEDDNYDLIETLTLTKEQELVVNEYVNMIINIEDTFNELIDMIPYNYFDNAKITLTVIIKELSKNNINHFTNKMLVILNNELKQNIVKKMKRKNKKSTD